MQFVPAASHSLRYLKVANGMRLGVAYHLSVVLTGYMVTWRIKSRSLHVLDGESTAYRHGVVVLAIDTI